MRIELAAKARKACGNGHGFVFALDADRSSLSGWIEAARQRTQLNGLAKALESPHALETVMRMLSQRSWSMFRMTVKPWRDTSPFLGIGTYYLRPENMHTHRAESWVKVTLEKPLLLGARQMRRLVESYGTRSPDAMAAMAGAWRLRRDILKRGHDGIIAIDRASRESRVTVVDLARAGNPRGGASGPVERRAAEISRLPRTEFADER